MKIDQYSTISVIKLNEYYGYERIMLEWHLLRAFSALFMILFAIFIGHERISLPFQPDHSL